MEKKIDVIGQMILAAIPVVVTPLYAFYKIKKFKKGVLVILLTLAIVMVDAAITAAMTESEFFMLESWEKPVDLSYQYFVGLIVTILLPMYFARKWTIEYNERPVSVQQISVADEIAKLAKLKEEGALTDQEFQTKKAELLGRS